MVSKTAVLRMQDYHIKNDLMTSKSLKSMIVNNYPQDVFRQKCFLNGLQNARNILNDLQESIQETKKYETQLMRCKSSHAHIHNTQEWSDSDPDQNDKKCSQPIGLYKDSETQDNSASAKSWSAMSIVCLQYQYEELSKRYKSLIQEYNERCEAMNTKDRELAQLQELAKTTHMQFVEAHTTLLAIGEKYMALRQRKHALKQMYSKKVHRLKSAVTKLIVAADRSREKLDARLERALRTESHGRAALLLSEIRKCNHLCLENLRLKALIQELIPRHDVPCWDYQSY